MAETVVSELGTGAITPYKLALMVGLPRSGKSTFCKEVLLKDGYAIVSPDTFRVALHGRNFVPEAEDFVWAAVRLAVRALLMDGTKVVVDATNTTEEARMKWVKMAEDLGIATQYFVMEFDEGGSNSRNMGPGCVPAGVIKRMASRYEPPTLDSCLAKINLVDYYKEENHFEITPVGKTTYS